MPIRTRERRSCRWRMGAGRLHHCGCHSAADTEFVSARAGVLCPQALHGFSSFAWKSDPSGSTSLPSPCVRSTRGADPAWAVGLLFPCGNENSGTPTRRLDDRSALSRLSEERPEGRYRYDAGSLGSDAITPSQQCCEPVNEPCLECAFSADAGPVAANLPRYREKTPCRSTGLWRSRG